MIDTMYHSIIVVSNQLEEFIRLQKVNLADCGEGVSMGEGLDGGVWYSLFIKI